MKSISGQKIRSKIRLNSLYSTAEFKFFKTSILQERTIKHVAFKLKNSWSELNDELDSQQSEIREPVIADPQQHLWNGRSWTARDDESIHIFNETLFSSIWLSKNIEEYHLNIFKAHSESDWSQSIQNQAVAHQILELRSYMKAMESENWAQSEAAMEKIKIKLQKLNIFKIKKFMLLPALAILIGFSIY